MVFEEFDRLSVAEKRALMVEYPDLYWALARHAGEERSREPSR